VQVRPPLLAPLITGPSLVCEGDSLILTSNAPGLNVHWSGPNGFESDEVSPVIYPATPLHEGFYTAYYTLNGCKSPVSIPIEVKVQSEIPAPGLDADTTRVCIDDPVPLQICLSIESGTTGATYLWIFNGIEFTQTVDPTDCITIDGSLLQSGLNGVSVIATLNSCRSDTSQELTLTGDEIPNVIAEAGPDMLFCPDETIQLDAADPSPSSGMWTTSSGEVIISDTDDPHTPLNDLPPGSYDLTWTLSFESCKDYSSDSVTIGVLFSPEVFPDTIDVPFGQTVEFIVTANDTISMDPFILDIINHPQKGNVLHTGNGIFRYTPNIGFVGTDILTYRICSTDCPEECSETTVVLRVGNEDDCFVPTLFTPNEDGVNDVLVIPCLETERFPQNKIIIFNEWGAVVYTASPYENDWDGKVSGEALPVGTYFYIMDFGDGSDPKRTFLVLER
jgi:gliding motility-associated-like protein